MSNLSPELVALAIQEAQDELIERAKACSDILPLLRAIGCLEYPDGEQPLTPPAQ